MKNSDIKVAVVGCGYWGKNLVRNFAALDALAAVCDPNQEHTENMANQFGAPSVSFEQILANPTISGVAIAAPAELHYRLARQALAAGKNVYVEKPLSLVAKDAADLCRFAAKQGLVLMVGHLLQYHPAFLKLKDMVAEGVLGTLQYIYSNRLNLGKLRREENILWSFAPHDISMILSLVGEEPDKVTATGAAYVHNTIADVTITHLSFPGGVRAHVFVSWLHPFKEQKLVIVGSESMAVFDDGQPWSNKILLYPHKIEWSDGIPVSAKANAVPVPVDADEPLKLECQHFLDCIARGETPRTDGAEGLRVLNVLQAAQDALDNGGAK